MEALKVAQENAQINEVTVNFHCVHILKPINQFIDSKFDIIVSNPPYIPTSEQFFMDKNVTQYEPHLALFVPDNEPLIFYHKITDLAAMHLKTGGFLYFEINEKYGTQCAELLQSKGFTNIVTKTDINGKIRMIKGEKHWIN